MSNTPYRVSQISAPAHEPVSLDEAKAHLRIDHDADDGLVGSLIVAARIACEGFTGRAFVTRGMALFLDRWPVQGETTDAGLAAESGMVFKPADILLPHPPLAGVDDILVYKDDDVADSFDPAFYIADKSGVKGRVSLKPGAPIPYPAIHTNGIEIRYDAGYGDAEDVPMLIKQAILQMVAQLYENRGDSRALEKSGAETLLQHYRVMGVR